MTLSIQGHQPTDRAGRRHRNLHADGEPCPSHASHQRTLSHVNVSASLQYEKGATNEQYFIFIPFRHPVILQVMNQKQ